MRCPMSFNRVNLECLKEDCACWDKEYECCNEVTQTKVLKLIHEDLYAISGGSILEVLGSFGEAINERRIK